MPRYYTIVVNENGEGILAPLKAWVRNNRNQLPPDFPERGTTHQWKRRLAGIGWTERIGLGNVYVIRPDVNGSIAYADDFVDEMDLELEEEENLEEAQEMTFGLERDLQEAIRRNIQILEPDLQIIDGGTERNTAAGRIDITARDRQGRIVIIELKAPTAKPEVIAQTLAYMEAVRVEEQAEVRGIIVASDFADRVKLAARQIPNLRLVKYAFAFNFNQID